MEREVSVHARQPVLPHACFISFITRPLCWSRNTIFTQFLFPLLVFSSNVLQWFTDSDTDGSHCSCVFMGGGWNIGWPMILAFLLVHLWQARRLPLHQQCLCCHPAPQPEPRVLRWGGRLSWLCLPHLFLIVLYHSGFIVLCVSFSLARYDWWITNSVSMKTFKTKFLVSFHVQCWNSFVNTELIQ